MPRQHPAFVAARRATAATPKTSERLPAPRSPLASVPRTGLLLLSLLLVSSGCFRPYQAPSGGYGSPYGYPAGGVPTQTLQPGGTYTPSPYGQPATPYNNTFPQPTPGYPSTIDQTGGSSPFYGSGGSGGTTQPYDGGGVPTYSDPNEVKFQQPIPNDSTAVESWRLIDSGLAQVSLSSETGLAGAGPIVDESDFERHAAPDAVATGLPSVHTAAGATEVPREVELPHSEPSIAGNFQFPQTDPASEAEAAPAPFPGASGEATPLPSVATPVPDAVFAHDAEFHWLRGVLRFDPARGVWTMIYSDNPSEEDEHGGKVVVADSPLLEQFKPQAVVLLRGAVDEEESATAGRAVYRADVIEPVDLSVP
jgi:hypothetical protein